MWHCCKVDVGVKLQEVALEERCRDQYRVVVTCHVTSLVPNKTWYQTGLSSRMSCTYIQQVLCLNLTREWADPTCRFLFFSLQEYTQQNSLSKF
jgi:hypothetical protein